MEIRPFVVVDVMVAPFGTKNLSLSLRRRLRENGGGCKKRSRIPWDEKRCSRNEARVVKRSRAKGKRFPSCSRRRLAFNRRRRGRAARAEVVYAGSTTSDRAREPPIETAGSGFRGLPPSRNCSSPPATLPRSEETVPGTWRWYYANKLKYIWWYYISWTLSSVSLFWEIYIYKLFNIQEWFSHFQFNCWIKLF